MNRPPDAEFDYEARPSLQDADETELQDAFAAPPSWQDGEALRPDLDLIEEPESPLEAKVATRSKPHTPFQTNEGRSLKGAVEALLFLTSKPLSIHEIAERLGIPSFDAEEALLDVVQEYAFRCDSSLEIGDSEEGYILQVREEYTALTNEMIPMNLSVATVRTLSVIAIQGPLLQSVLIERRGSSAYDHIQELLRHKLVSKKRSGRSYLLSVTPLFQEQFKLKGKPDDLALLVELDEGSKSS